MKKNYMWLVDFYIRDPFDNDLEARCVKVSEEDLQHAITKACHLIEEEYRHIGIEYFVHNAGLAADDENENTVMNDPLGDPYELEWY